MVCGSQVNGKFCFDTGGAGRQDENAIGEAEVLAAIRRAQPDTMSPIEAMQLLYELKQKLS